MENKAYESGEHSTSHGNGAIEAIENGTLTSKENGIQHCKENGISHHEGNGMPQLKEIGMPLHRENEMLQAKEKGTKQDRENGMSHHKDDNHRKSMIPIEQNTTVQDNEESDDNSIHLCGAFNRYPKWLQRFANPRCFLLAFCIQNIIGGAEFAFTLGSTTSIEKHFQFSSGDIGMLILLSEIGPIITSVLLSFMGGRGNRPKWMCIGLIIGSIGVFLNFSTFLLYPAPTLSESGLLGESSKKFCSLQDVIDYQHSNTTSTTTTSSSLTLQLLDVKGSHETCQHSKNFSYFIWLIGYTCKALSGTLIYTIGAPYLDDGISSNSSPIYFAISLSVRVVGPAIGFALSAIALNAYVYPGKNYGIKPNDPRWVGAWWIGPLIFSILMFLYSFVLVLFPRKMGKSSSSSDVEKESPGNQYALEKKMQDEELVRTSVVPRDEMLVGSEILKGRFTNENFNRHASLENGKCNLNDDHEYESTKSCDNKIILKNQPAKTIIGKFIQKCLPEKQQEGLGEFTKALKRLSKNRVVVYGALADFSAIVAEAGLFFWKAKYQEHQFRVTKSTATLFSGLSGTLSLILGVVGGGIWVSRYRPRAKTVAHLMMSCGIMYMISLVGMMFISCDFQQDLPGILSTDKRSVELYRGCSSGCNCDQKEFIPVCIKDGPISLTYFSPCHAGCPDSNAKPHAEGQDEAFHNCTCGSQQATVTSGYCQDTCSGFILYNVITLIVKSFISVGVIGGTLISLRCVAVEDKAIALGVKSTMLSAALVVNPVIFGSLIDSACLVWEESCNGKGSCWLYNTDDFRYKLHGLPCIFITCCVFFTYMVARHLGELELVEDDSQLSSLSPTSSLFSNSVGERTSSIRRSLKKISSRLMGGEIGLSISPGKEKEISHSVFLRSEQNKNSWDSQGKGKESSHTRSPERNKEKISSRTLKEKTERKHECSEPQSVENAIGINDKSGNILSSGDSMLFNEDSPLSNAVENIHSAKVPKTTGV